MTTARRTPAAPTGGCERLAALFADIAYEASRADGCLHVEQFRALRAVLEDVGAEDIRRVDVETLADRVEAAAPDLASRRWLWLTAAWVCGADGRFHGDELWLLCRLRRLLALTPDDARRLWRAAVQSRRRTAGPPTPAEYRALRRLVAPTHAWPC